MASSSIIFKLEGLGVLVTGGGSGLGKATVQHLVKNGAKVLICDLNGEDVAKALPDDKCAFIKTDVSSEDDVENALKFFESKFKRLDIIVNCAGILPMEHMYDVDQRLPHSLEMFEHVIKVNLTGTFNVCRLACRLLTSNSPNEGGQRGVIINVSSNLAMEGTSNSVAYSASKGAVASMTLPMARDLSSVGIRVMAIAPGYFDTPLAKLLPKDAFAPMGKSLIPLFPNRPGNPEEFAYLVETIIRNPMLNGEIIRLDGAQRISH